SLGDNPRAQAPLDLSFEAAIEEAWAAGAVPVVASGNPNALGPGKEDFASLDALVVGATDTRGTVAPYSNPLTTTKWGLVAPGGSGTGDGRDIVSAWWDPSAPVPTTSTPTTAGAATEQATTGAGQEAVRVARERALGTTDVAGARDEVPSPGTVWAAIALMTAAAFGLALSGRRGR